MRSTALASQALAEQWPVAELTRAASDTHGDICQKFNDSGARTMYVAVTNADCTTQWREVSDSEIYRFESIPYTLLYRIGLDTAKRIVVDPRASIPRQRRGDMTHIIEMMLRHLEPRLREIAERVDIDPADYKRESRRLVKDFVLGMASMKVVDDSQLSRQCAVFDRLIAELSRIDRESDDPVLK